jgi:hypothetical protein
MVPWCGGSVTAEGIHCNFVVLPWLLLAVVVCNTQVLVTVGVPVD